MAGLWRCANLGDALLAAEASERIAADFLHHYAGTDVPRAIVSRHESQGRLHCELLVYFSPACRDLALQWRGRACPAPGLAGSSLVACSGGQWPDIYPYL